MPVLILLLVLNKKKQSNLKKNLRSNPTKRSPDLVTMLLVNFRSKPGKTE